MADSEADTVQDECKDMFDITPGVYDITSRKYALAKKIPSLRGVCDTVLYTNNFGVIA
jgi:hypothetical protein